MVNKTVLNGTECYGKSIIFCYFSSLIEGLEDNNKLTFEVIFLFLDI